MVNTLLGLPFALKVATKDWHPKDHISFASNHEPPNNAPFTSEFLLKNPYNPTETETIRLWPVHCVQGSDGAKLVPELDISKLDHVIEKGQDARIEMYSAFADPFTNPTVSRSTLAETLKAVGITHVYVVGLAMDYCVRYTAEDAAREGFTTYVIQEGTKAVDASNWSKVEAAMHEANVRIVPFDGEEMERVRQLTATTL